MRLAVSSDPPDTLIGRSVIDMTGVGARLIKGDYLHSQVVTSDVTPQQTRLCRIAHRGDGLLVQILCHSSCHIPWEPGLVLAVPQASVIYDLHAGFGDLHAHMQVTTAQWKCLLQPSMLAPCLQSRCGM